MAHWLGRCAAALGLGVGGIAVYLRYQYHLTYEDPGPLAHSSLLSVRERVAKCSPGVHSSLARTLADNGVKVSTEDIEKFKEKGYLVVRGMFPVEYIEAMDTEARAYFDEYKGMQAFFRPWSKRNAIHGIGHIAGWARDLQSRMSGIGQLAAQLLGTDEPILLAHDALDCINPSQGSAGTAPFRRVRAIRAWIPFQDITNDKTGCTIVIPGSQTWDNDCTMGHYTDTTKPLCPSYSDLYLDDWGNSYYQPWVGENLKRGDVVFLAPNVLHGWGPNESGKPRLAMRATMIPKSWGYHQPLAFHGQGPDRLVMPELYPDNEPAQSDEGWPLRELTFGQFAEFSLKILARSVKYKLIDGKTEERYLKPERVV